MDHDLYRGDLTAAFARIARLEHELSVFRADPAHERVEIAEERLSIAQERRSRAQRLLPRVMIVGFVLMGAYALTDPSLPPLVNLLGSTIAALGGLSALVSLTVLLVLLAQGPHPPRLRDLERDIRLAKADVGTRRTRLRVVDDPALVDLQDEPDFETTSSSRRAI